ncbi:hypothetical protein GUITHDRAFT_112693 [Guillardia theta CCMP2712]|uniref:Uncharacterized protein n=1 Tax=Guillardia theta (strain CCMP2712) TaxID=905079 RepID=L1IYP7_GUITC|nr:hypothetical protein GUITHDRAFT_112693 [Guillardia theta CCMP2712]EKX41222.1 hypothetical protein GUITHDRAFT_112693 [Guillardia theta CCMP2712]|eukprot:XP_005828202.1 hypothetical protein GUITHDRAFT_112693 [Guillardia theta CCMP2712]
MQNQRSFKSIHATLFMLLSCLAYSSEVCIGSYRNEGLHARTGDWGRAQKTVVAEVGRVDLMRIRGGEAVTGRKLPPPSTDAEGEVVLDEEAKKFYETTMMAPTKRLVQLITTMKKEFVDLKTLMDVHRMMIHNQEK